MKAIMSQLRLGDLAKAEQELGSLLTDFAGHKELGPVVHEVVEEYRDTGAHEQGRELFAYLLENWDETPDTMLELQVGIALQSVKLRELDKADAAVAKLIADYNDHPKIAKALFQIAEQHYYAKNYWKTVNLLELIERDYADRDFPTRDEIPYILGTCYEKLEKYQRATEHYLRVVREFPESKYAHRAPYRLGIQYRRRGDYAASIYWFDQQSKLYSDGSLSERALFFKGIVYLFNMKEYEKAADVFDEYLELYAESENAPLALYDLALCYEGMGHDTEAIELLQAALAQYPESIYATDIADKLVELQEELK
jgi:TolA-binding protein